MCPSVSKKITGNSSFLLQDSISAVPLGIPTEKRVTNLLTVIITGICTFPCLSAVTVFLSLLWFKSQMHFCPRHPISDLLLPLLFSCDTSMDVSHDIFTVKPQLNRKSNQILSYCSGDKFLLPFLHQIGNKWSLDELQLRELCVCRYSLFSSTISPRPSCFNRFLILLLNYWYHNSTRI